MGNKQQKQQKIKEISQQAQIVNQMKDAQRSKSADPYLKVPSSNNSVYGVKVTPTIDPIKQMQRSQMNSSNMLNQSQLNRSAITPPPRMGQSKYGATNDNIRLQDQIVGQPLQQQGADPNRSYVLSVADRANINRQYKSAMINQNNSRLDISMRVDQKRSVSPNKLFPPKEEVQMMLSNIRKKEIMQTREKEYTLKKMHQVKKAIQFVQNYANAVNFFDVESQLNSQANMLLNLNNYETFILLRNESQNELQKMAKEGENNQDKLNEKQKLYERSVQIIKIMDQLKKDEFFYQSQIDYTGLIKEKEQVRNREQSLENILKQDISSLSQTQYGEHKKQNSHPNLQLKEMLAEVEPIQKESNKRLNSQQSQLSNNIISNNNNSTNNNLNKIIQNTDSEYQNSFKSSTQKDKQFGIQSSQKNIQQKHQSNQNSVSNFQQQPQDGNKSSVKQLSQQQQQLQSQLKNNSSAQLQDQLRQKEYAFQLSSNLINNPMASTIKINSQEANSQNKNTSLHNLASNGSTSVAIQQAQSNLSQNSYYPQSQQNAKPNSVTENINQQMQQSINQGLPHFSQLQQPQFEQNRNNNFQEQNLPQFSNPVSNNTSPDVENRYQNQNQFYTTQNNTNAFKSEQIRPSSANTNQQMRFQSANNQFQQEQNFNQQQLYQQDQQNPAADSEYKSQRKQWFNSNENNQINQVNLIEETGKFQNNSTRNQFGQNFTSYNNQNMQGIIPHSQSSVQLSNPQFNQNQFENKSNNFNQYQQQQQEDQNYQVNIIPANPRSLTPNSQQVFASDLTNQINLQNFQQQQQQPNISQINVQPATTRNIRKEIEVALANKQRRASLQHSEIQTMKNSMNTNQPMKESYITNMDGTHLLPYQQNYQTQNYENEEDYQLQVPQNTSQVNESYLSKNNVNVYIGKERLQKKGNDIQVYRNVKLNKVKAGQQNNITQHNTSTNALNRKGSKIIQINKQNNITSMKNSGASNNNNNYLQQHLNKVASQKQIYKPLNASSSQNVVQDQFHMIMNQQQLQEQNLFNNMSAINYPNNANNQNHENSFLSNNSNILLNDQSLLENYHISKMHQCDANHEHERFKTPKKYQNIESHYSPNNLQFYLNKDHKSYSNNQKWVQEKTIVDKTNNAGARTFWDRKPDSEIRTQTKNQQITQKLTNQTKQLETGMKDMQKSIALYKSNNEKIYKSTIEIPTLPTNQIQESPKKQYHLKYDIKNNQSDKNQSEQMNRIFVQHLQQQANNGSLSDRSHYTQIYPREFDTIKNIQLRDQNLQNIHKEVYDLSNRVQNGLKNQNNFNHIKSSNNLSENNDDNKNKVVYQTLGVPTSNNAFYQPNWVQINKSIPSKSHNHSQDEYQNPGYREDEQIINHISKHESPEIQKQQNTSISQFQKQRQQFYQQREIQNQNSHSESYYHQIPQSQQGSDQKQYSISEQRIPAQPSRNYTQQQALNQSNQMTMIHKYGPDNSQYQFNQGEQSAEVDSIKKELLV
ncbi:hypothetical protein TTHERM_01094800 (macronuclear) [Tetrahymena thermophila SB210]|uniref:Uncharacterized protein n=1 Tax=Tetrahymena thermophila (strain SB210) TaxID=312017 RepID=Q22ZI0_TETTS|nr:hypothetical protein TTHERM_01094800 [Tetrahymena thermophila SB210]EAR90667.2 hypothetical protein TTHERM_01094800 [Tetrahymena thermophila SB210]|eukprot:XP_001010912.2 hypothetical protein TTHERM_01094800 [Tetrahymena thermophila SB210]